LVAFFSFCGARYDPNLKPKNRFPLYLYFFVILIVLIALGLGGTLCVIAWEKVYAIVEAKLPELQEYFLNTFPDIPMTDITAEMILDLVMTNLKIVGFIGIGLAALLVFSLLLSASILGRLVWEFTLTLGNLALFIGGAGGVALGIYVYITDILPASITTLISLVIGILGGCVAAIALCGWISICCAKRCCVCLYSTIILTLLLAVVALGVIMFFQSDMVKEQVTAFCETSPSCEALLNSTAADAVANYVAGNFKMVAAGACWLGGFVAYLVIAGYIYTCLGKKDKPTASKSSISNVEEYPMHQEPVVQPAPMTYGNL